MCFYDTLYERNLIKTHSLTFYLIGAFWLGIVNVRIHTFAGSKSIAYTSCGPVWLQWSNPMNCGILKALNVIKKRERLCESI